MKIIEALKKIKDLRRKADDIKDKIQKHSADLDCETPAYPDQRRQVAEWLQSHGDIIKEIAHLKTSIQRTNLATMVTIPLGDNHVKKCISEWIDRRKELAKLQEDVWRILTDKGLKETYQSQLTPNSPATMVKKRLYFDPAERDKNVELYRSEPSVIDSTLEITNAITDLIER
jgi:hypothetical protein